jgi:hypothetical protein
LDITTLSYSDIKKSARKFVLQNWADEIVQVYEDVACQISPPFDEQMHNELANRHIHCDFSGKPCQAWSRNRDKSGGSSSSRKAGSVESHPLFATTFTDSFAYLDSDADGKKHGGISEQPEGFMKEVSDGCEGHSSPFEMCKAELRKRNFYVGSAHLNLDSWIDEPERKRMFIVYVDDYLGGRQALKWILNAIQDRLPCSSYAIPLTLSCFHYEFVGIEM